MDAVNVEYRLASQGLAPAAVEDGRCALHWVAEHAAEYGFDPRRIVVAGESAGGHLALMTGMLTPADGFDAACELPPERWAQHGGPSQVKVAAIINFFGPTDLVELAQPPYADNFVLRWLGNRPDRIELARRLSPITYVRRDLPPIITIHGEKDNIVPYDNATRLRDALDRSAAINQLVTIGGGHGGYAAFPWTREQNSQAYMQVHEFLSKVGIFAPSMHAQLPHGSEK
jgi:acetyl esterase/lipase